MIMNTFYSILKQTPEDFLSTKDGHVKGAVRSLRVLQLDGYIRYMTPGQTIEFEIESQKVTYSEFEKGYYIEKTNNYAKIHALCRVLSVYEVLTKNTRGVATTNQEIIFEIVEDYLKGDSKNAFEPGLWEDVHIKKVNVD